MSCVRVQVKDFFQVREYATRYDGISRKRFCHNFMIQLQNLIIFMMNEETNASG